ncbi:hypothetical protein CC78DRAFT_565405 [Lojkania enalia]|uniref:Inheritance of peroxisomes protein 1 n=1 Tax=Lojkania enalia TaxID=147567 RepID=A0A9P4KH62_9PLEO|nr:hypothetical protein CC78DRAFT_565405 [Didymosphaeria enalia]
MSSPPAARTPEHAPPQPSNPSIRRSFTIPTHIANQPRPAQPSVAGANGIETLFTHASSKIVSFTAASSSRQTSHSRGVVTETPGSIPWRSPTERTLAVGTHTLYIYGMTESLTQESGGLRIYRVTASNVSFLNSGNFLHTIFPKSQCWCVDGESVFVLRIRQDSYYRIELPYQSEEDRSKVEEFKAVLAQVLQYEKTRCPFTRGFEVELPERPKTPPLRRPRKPAEKAKKWLFDKTWVPEDGPRPSTPVLEGSDSGTGSSYEEDDRSSVTTDTVERAPESPVAVLNSTPLEPPPAPSVSERAKLFQGRSATAPSGVMSAPAPGSVEPADASSGATRSVREGSVQKERTDALSLISSADSFYSLEDVTQRSPSPPYLDAETDPASPDAGTELIISQTGAEFVNPWSEEQGSRKEEKQEQPSLRGRERHRRQASEVTITAHSSERTDESPPQTPTNDNTPAIDLHPSSAPSTPPLISDSEEDSFEPPFLDVPTPPDTIRLRRLTGASQRRAFSPMPHPQNLFCPPVQPRKQFTAALVRRTCELILGPPAHLVTLMLRIAAKISLGSFGFNTYRVRHTGEKIPCSWESSDEDEWEEDDYGIPLGNLEGSMLRRRVPSGEVD